MNFTNIDINTTELFGTKTIELYNGLNEAALTFGFTLLGILAICYVVSLVIKPIFYLLFTIKLGYQGICETCKLIKGFFSFIIYLYKKIKEIYKNNKRRINNAQNGTDQP